MIDDKTTEKSPSPPPVEAVPAVPHSSSEQPPAHPPPHIPDYELLRVIGRGSYGEVWLARNVMGGHQAVKVIYRHTFEHQRPYEREFEGIKRYEPVSRTHESQVAVLHVGRHERDEYYYYVMELADDGSESRLQAASRDPPTRTPEPAKAGTPNEDRLKAGLQTYTPRTLASELKQRGRLPLDECVSLGLSLATALEHLHNHGLIHRDIKPSNVIFIHGVPKMADVGLIAEKDCTVSFVGTRGYFPPEGPGTAQADIFSLGKVLYEISTGRDRNEFPELPSELEDLAEEARLLEFNEILLKACHGDERRRYTSARELFDDLSLLQAGKSVKRRRSRERLVAGARRAVVVVALTLVVALGGFLVARKPVRIANVAPRQLRPDNAAFWRTEELLRWFDFSPDGDRIVFGGEKGLSIWDEKTSITRPLALRGIEGWRPGPRPRWAPDGRHFVVQASKKIGGTPEEPIHTSALFLTDPETGEARQVGPEFPAGEGPGELCWLPDGNAITYFSQGRFYTLHLSGGRSLWVDSQLPGEAPGIRLGSYSPEGKWLLLSAAAGTAGVKTDRHIWLMPHSGGRAVPVVQRPGINLHPTWGPDGETVYFVSSGGQRNRDGTWGLWKIRIDPKTGVPRGESQEVFVKNGLKMLHPKFVANGRKLAYAVEEPDTRVWVAEAERLDQPEGVVRGQDPVPSPDGRTIYFVGETPEQRGIFAIDRNGKSGPRQVTALAPLSHRVTRGGIDLSPDGEQIALFSVYGKRFGVFVVPTAGGEATLLEELTESEGIVPVWSPDGHWLAYTADKVLHRVSRDGKAREALATLYRWDGWSVRWSPDGRHIAAFAYASPEEWEDKTGVFVVDVATKGCKKVSPDTETEYKEGLEWHPDGQRLTYMFYGPERDGAQLRWAYLDGRPTELMIDQPDHWDYVGVWAPDGRRFFFSSTDCKGPQIHLHIYDAQSKEITHGVRSGSLPVWSRDEKTVVWTSSKPIRYFEVLEDFR
ncbi:MAG: serine/threonine-protein kinase [Verrucomicrobia bacterium]|nr:serine/threonine-protein kinase [Verrucomicrobiota bacterium]